ncbi:MAG: hypothetical protein KDC24_12185 [Saprospiraceae bacterium]|nr:hypothetical protein [Saprospiraceae bacterium]
MERLGPLENVKAASTDFGQLAGMVEQGLADFFVFPLEMIPYKRSEKMVVTALAGRPTAGWTLLVHQDFHDAGKILQIPAGGQLLVPNGTVANWLKEIRPDIKTTILPEPTFFFTGQQLDPSKAWLLPTHLVQAAKASIPYWLDRDILPEELPGLAGQGAIALVAPKDNIVLRRKLNTVHQRDLVPHCNVERSIDRDLRDALADPFLAFCKKAANRPFELFVKMLDKDKALQSYHLSSGTHLNLKEELERMMGGMGE